MTQMQTLTHRRRLAPLRRLIPAAGLAAGLAAALGVALLAGPAAASDWKAPPEADGYKNPNQATAESVAAGRKVFMTNCVLCHGEKADGNGATAKTLPVKPANLGDKALIGPQSDGALAWKILTGRGPMPSWAPVLQEDQIWNVVNFIRGLSR